MLSKEQIEIFKRDGVLVVPNVFSQDEIQEARQKFHNRNKILHEIDHDLILQSDPETLQKINGPRIKSPISNTFYSKWKLDIALDPRVWEITSTLWKETFAKQELGFQHPFGKFDPQKGGAFIDRVCYRLPDHICKEDGLLPHLDRNPYDPYLTKSTGLTKWRPIQSFVALTDQYGGASGGLRCVRGFHLETDQYFKTCQPTDLSGGEFYRLSANNHKKLYSTCHPVDAPAGSMVLWDNRIVHSTSSEFVSDDTREVVYVGYLPSHVPCNEKYLKEQTTCIKNNIIPPNYQKRVQGTEYADRDWEDGDLTELQKKLLFL